MRERKIRVQGAWLGGHSSSFGSNAAFVPHLASTSPPSEFALFDSELGMGVFSRRLAPAVKCVSALTVSFFGIYLAVVCTRLLRASFWWFAGKSLRVTLWERKLVEATESLGMAPMLSVLMISTRLRAMQLDPSRETDPAAWVQVCMYLGTVAFFTRVAADLILSENQGGGCLPAVAGRSSGGVHGGGAATAASLPLSWLPSFIIRGGAGGGEAGGGGGGGGGARETRRAAGNNSAVCEKLSRLCLRASSVVLYVTSICILIFGALASPGDVTRLARREEATRLSAMMICMAVIMAVFLVESMLLEVLEVFWPRCRPAEALQAGASTSCTSYVAGRSLVEVCPLHFPIMVCVFLVGLEMRAVQLRLQPNFWATGAMYVTASSIAVQVVWGCMLILLRFLRAQHSNSVTEPAAFKVADHHDTTMQTVLRAVWALLLLSLYIGTSVMLLGAVVMEERPVELFQYPDFNLGGGSHGEMIQQLHLQQQQHQQHQHAVATTKHGDGRDEATAAASAWQGTAGLLRGLSNTLSRSPPLPSSAMIPASQPPLAPSMQCVMLLTVVYFNVYLFMITCSAVPGATRKWAERIFSGVQHALTFAPMLCVMMISVRLRAMQLKKYDPQQWAQEAMFIATFAVIVQVVCSLFRIEDVADTTIASKVFHIIVLVAKYVAASVLFVTVGALVVAVMTLS